MAQDNTLGAPTEGLGQTVTFGFDARSGVPTLQPVDPGNYRGGIQGAPVRGGLNITGPEARMGENPTLALLMKVGDQVLQKHIAEKRTEQFVSGMQRAMTGEAVKDIADQQPWYSKVFGDSAVVEGARQYAQQANVTNALTKIEEEMPEVRKLTSADAQEYFANVVKESMTGEPATDAAIMAAYARSMPSVMKRQVKEHYGWKQEQASVAESQMINAMSGRLQKAAEAHNKGFIDDTEYAALTGEVIQASAPPAGRDEKSWQMARANDLIGMAKRGELHALNAFVGQGILDVLTPQQANAVAAAREAGERMVKSKYDAEWSDRLVNLRTRAAQPEVGTDTKSLLAQVDAANAEFNKLTGSRSGIISAEERSALGTRSATAILEAQRREAERLDANERAAGTAGAKVAAESAKDAYVIASFHQETLSNTKVMDGYTNDRIDRVLTDAFNKTGSFEARAEFIRKAHINSHVVKPVADSLVGNVRRALQAGPQAVDGAMMPVYEQWKAINARDPSAAHSYYGEFANKLARFHQAVEAGVPVAGAYTIFTERDARGKLDKKEVAAAVGEVKSAFSGILPGWAPMSKSLQAGQAEIAVDYLSGDIEALLGTYKDPKVAAEIAIKSATAKGTLESIGGYVWGLGHTDGQRMQPIAKYLTSSASGTRVPFGADGEQADEAVAKAIDFALYGDGTTAGIIPQTGLLGQKADVVRIYRLPDVAGEPVLWINAVVGGETKNARVTGSMLFEARDKAKQAATVRTAPLDIQPGYESPTERRRRERLAEQRNQR